MYVKKSSKTPEKGEIKLISMKKYKLQKHKIKKLTSRQLETDQLLINNRRTIDDYSYKLKSLNECIKNTNESFLIKIDHYKDVIDKLKIKLSTESNKYEQLKYESQYYLYLQNYTKSRTNIINPVESQMYIPHTISYINKDSSQLENNPEESQYYTQYADKVEAGSHLTKTIFNDKIDSLIAECDMSSSKFCNSFLIGGKCNKKDCIYRHCTREHINQKAILCNYHRNGYCKYGNICRFSHK